MNVKRLKKLVAKQAEDRGLWFVAQYASEAYLQQALRILHEAIERLPGTERKECRNDGPTPCPCTCHNAPAKSSADCSQGCTHPEHQGTSAVEECPEKIMPLLNLPSTFNHRNGMGELKEFEKRLSVEEWAKEIALLVIRNPLPGDIKVIAAVLAAYGEERYIQGHNDGFNEGVCK